MTILPYDRSRLHAMLVALDQQAERDLRRHLLHARYDTAVLMRAENRSRRVLQALDSAKDPALKRLRLQFSQVDIATIWPQLSEICHDVALCLGMATLASQAALEALLAQVFNAGAMGKSMVAGLRDAGSTYRMGLGKLWGLILHTPALLCLTCIVQRPMPAWLPPISPMAMRSPSPPCCAA